MDHFDSSIRLKDFYFVHLNGQRDDVSISEECELLKLSLVFYKEPPDTSSSDPREIDTALPFFKGPPEKCYEFGGNHRGTTLKYPWAVVDGTPGNYPFDEYKLNLKPEEFAEFSGTATDSRPELIRLTTTDPRLSISSFVIKKRHRFCDATTTFVVASLSLVPRAGNL